MEWLCYNKKLNELFDRMSPDDIDLMLENFGCFIKENRDYDHSQRFINRYKYIIQKPRASDTQNCKLLNNINIAINSCNNQKNDLETITYKKFYDELLKNISEVIIIKKGTKKSTPKQLQTSKYVANEHFQKNGPDHLNNSPLPPKQSQQEILQDINQMLETPFNEKDFDETFNPEDFTRLLKKNTPENISETRIALATPRQREKSLMTDSLSRRNNSSSLSALGN